MSSRQAKTGEFCMTTDEIRAEMARIPEGKVLTFSQITSEACAVVGRVQNEEPEGWHRVVYKNGRVRNKLQRRMLKREGVEFVTDWTVQLRD